MPLWDQLEVERLRKYKISIHYCIALSIDYSHCLSAWFILCLRLLDVLADRKAKKGLSGHVLINGKRQPHNFKFTSAYVVQVS